MKPMVFGPKGPIRNPNWSPPAAKEMATDGGFPPGYIKKHKEIANEFLWDERFLMDDAAMAEAMAEQYASKHPGEKYVIFLPDCYFQTSVSPPEKTPL
jgi:hypothetical protein